MASNLTDQDNLVACYRRELLEIGRSDDMDFSKIVKIMKGNQQCEKVRTDEVGCKATIDFMDDPEVPPLE